MPTFNRHLRHWRTISKLSQMQLALECDFSPKHLNQLETGKARPTRETVLTLAKVMSLSFNNTNGMLIAAGFSPEYQSTDLASDSLSFTRFAIRRMLEQHDPFPAIVTDPVGNILMQNNGANCLLALLVNPELLKKTQNAYEIYFSDDGFRPYIMNWTETSQEILRHLEQEVLAIPPGKAGYDLISRLERDYRMPDNWRETIPKDEKNAIFHFHFCKNGVHLKFFSTYTTFGTPRDAALQDIRIESFFPADNDTQKFCETLHQQASDLNQLPER